MKANAGAFIGFVVIAAGVAVGWTLGLYLTRRIGLS
jgi:hypothetical protein